MSRCTSLVLALLAGWFAHANVLAQPPAVFLRLKGIAVGGNLTGGGSDMQVLGNFVYLAGNGLQIFSLSNATAPGWVGGYESPVQANAIHVVGDFVYRALGSARNFTNDPGAFEIINVSDRANPVRVGGIDTPGRANAIRVAGNYAYVAESTRWTGSNLLGALEIFDVSTPTNPVRVATFDTAGSVTSVDVSGSHAYLADGVTDLQVLDVTNPGNPLRVGEYISDVSQNACGWEPSGARGNFVQVVGNLAYSSGDNGMHVLDISDPPHPTSISDAFCLPTASLHVSDRYAGATVYVSGDNAFLLAILDVSDPANLIQVGTKRPWPTVFRIVGNLIYSATNPLSVYEFSHQPAITSLSINAEYLNLTWEFAPGFVLQRTTSLAPVAWIDVPGSEDRDNIELSATNSIGFFRLARP